MKNKDGIEIKGGQTWSTAPAKDSDALRCYVVGYSRAGYPVIEKLWAGCEGDLASIEKGYRSIFFGHLEGAV